MANLSALANIPGYGAYIAKSQMNEQQGAQDLQQIGALMQLKQAIDAQKDQKQMRSMFSESGGNLEAVVQAALKAGRPDVAAKLAPLLEAQRKASAKPDPRVLAPGGRLVSPDGKVIAEAPFKPEAPKTPAHRQRYDGNKVIQEELQPDGTWKEIGAGPRFAPEKPPAEKTYPIITTGDGIFERRPEGLFQLKDPKTGKPLAATARERPITEFQGKNALYGTRAAAADKALLELEDKISTTGLAIKQSVQGVPVVGGALGAAGNTLLSANQQRVEQAQRNFVNAVLRQESGAVISDAEFENAKKQYFPAPGDTKAVIAQKRQNRQLAIQGFKKIAGPAWDEAPSGIPAPPTPEAPSTPGWGIRPL